MTPDGGDGREKTVWYPHHHLRKSMIMRDEEGSWAEVIEELRDEMAAAPERGALKCPNRCQ
jgi:hypothetical protein